MKILAATLLGLSFSASAFATQGPFSTCTGYASGTKAVTVFTETNDLSALEVGQTESINGQIQIGAEQLNAAILIVQNMVINNLTLPAEPAEGSGWNDEILSLSEVSGSLQGAPVLLNCENHYRARY